MRRQEQFKNLVKFGLSLCIWGAQVGVWAYFWLVDYADEIMRPFGYKGNWLVVAVYGIIAFFFTNIYGGYRVGYYKRGDIILSGFIAIFFANIITYLQTCLIGRAIMNALPFVQMTLIDSVLFVIWAFVSCGLYSKIFPPHKMLMVYGGKELATSLVQKMARREEKYRIVEAISAYAEKDEIIEKFKEYPAIILCDVPSPLRNELLNACFEMDIRVYTTPEISDILLRAADSVALFDTPILLNRNRGLSLEQRFIKRAMDIVFSAVMLVITSPFMLFTVIIVKLQDGGPVIFKQERATINNKHFFVYKFRSMIIDAEKDGISQPAVDGDKRITPVGRFIRTTRLDELPQLWNIFIGDMSIVGPRPERLEHVEMYTAEVPEFSYRLKVRAGLTGYAQVVGKYNTTAYDKLKMDLMYIAGYSLILDLKIMLMTFKILFTKESTEGMKDGKADSGRSGSSRSNSTDKKGR